ncbi:hypothetical protein EMIT0196MI5_80007 [Pseudomonas sp. IT-196MI5]
MPDQPTDGIRANRGGLNVIVSFFIQLPQALSLPDWSVPMRCDSSRAAGSEVSGPLICTPSCTRYQQASMPSSLSCGGTALPITDMI